MTLNNSIDASLQDWGDSPCFIECDSRGRCVPVSARELRGRIQDRTRQFAQWGIRKGFMVPMFLGNSIDFIDSLFALMNLGAIPVMVKLDFRKIELEEIFGNCRPQAIISEKNLDTRMPFCETCIGEPPRWSGRKQGVARRSRRHPTSRPRGEQPSHPVVPFQAG